MESGALVFLSYSRSQLAEYDQLVAQKLLVLLKPLTELGHRLFFDGTGLEVGEEIDPKIDEALAATNVAVLLVSPDYLDPDRYARQWELPALLSRHQAGECTLVPVMVRANPGWRFIPGLDGALFANDVTTPLQEAGEHLDTALARIADLIFARVLHSDAAPPATGGAGRRSPVAIAEPTRPKLHPPSPPAEQLQATEQPGDLIGVPSLPASVFARPADLDVIRRALAGDAVTGISGARSSQALGVVGQGGLGKTVMASVAAHDPEVRALFPDGIVWLTVGEGRPVLEAQVSLLRLLGADGNVRSISDAREQLSSILATSRRLIILDDLWTGQQFDQLAVTSGTSRTLVTTRHAALVLEPAGAAIHELGVLSGEDAAAFLARAAGCRVEELAIDVPLVEAATGGVPLGLALVGGALRHGVDPATVLTKLATDTFGDHPYANTFRALDLAAGALEPEARRRYLTLAVFLADTDIPLAVVRRFWRHLDGTTRADTDRELGALSRRNLIVLDGDVVRFHDLQHDYVRYANDRLVASLHSDLVESVRPATGAWHDLPRTQRYLWDNLVPHLQAARIPAAPAVIEPAWWVRRIGTSGVAALERDLAAAEAEQSPAGAVAREAGARLASRAHLLPASPPWDVAAGCVLWLGTDGAGGGGPWAPVLPPLWGELGPGTLARHVPPVRQLGGHADQVYWVAWSPTGDRLVSGGADGAIRMWDPLSGVPIFTVDAHDTWVGSVAWSPDGARLASGGLDGFVRSWASVDGAGILERKGHTGGVQAVAWSPDGTRFASASNDGTVRLWDALTGATIRELASHTSWVMTVAWSADGSRLASGGMDDTVRVWDPATGVELNQLSYYRVTSVAWSPNGFLLAVGGGAETVTVWDLEAGVETHELVGHTDEVESVAWSPDGTRLASTGDDGTVRVWDLAAGVETHLFEGRTGLINSVAWSPGGSRLASGSSDGAVRVWDPTRPAEGPQVEGHAGEVLSVAWSPDGTRLASASFDSTVRVWDPATGEELQRLEGQTKVVKSVVWSPDGCRLASGGSDGMAVVWDPVSGAVITRFGDQARSLASLRWSPDGGWLAAAGTSLSFSGGTVWLRDGATLAPAGELDGSSGRLGAISWSPDGSRLAAAGDFGRVVVWDVAAGAVIRTLRQYADKVNSVAWSPDGLRLACAGEEGTILVWDPENGAVLRRLLSNGTSVHSVDWSPDGLRLASAGDDGTVRIWDSRRLVAWRLGHSANAVRFSPDGSALAVAVDNDWVVIRLHDREGSDRR